LLGLLNSSVAKMYFSTVCAGLEGKQETYLRFFGQYLEGFPIPEMEPPVKMKLESLVDKMIDAKEHLTRTSKEDEVRFLKHKCDVLDSEIDTLVYQLYDLSQEEIKIVDGVV
jgi:adenine-specific DNA-methyltransferase